MPANGAGWYDAPVTIDWVSVDPVPSSGTPTDPPDTVIDTEGAAVTVESAPSCDPAGNCATGSVTVAIDVTDPVVAVTGFIDGASFELGSEPTVGCTTSDALSGVAVDATVAVTGGNPDGTGTFTATCSGATDVAGNTAGPVGASYEVQAVTPPSTITRSNVPKRNFRAGAKITSLYLGFFGISELTEVVVNRQLSDYFEATGATEATLSVTCLVRRTKGRLAVRTYHDQVTPGITPQTIIWGSDRPCMRVVTVLLRAFPGDLDGDGRVTTSLRTLDRGDMNRALANLRRAHYRPMSIGITYAR